MEEGENVSWNEDDILLPCPVPSKPMKPLSEHLELPLKIPQYRHSGRALTFRRIKDE